MDIPKPVQMLLQNMVKAAAPEIASQIDNLMAVAQNFKSQMDRIEANQQIIMRFLGCNQGEILNDGRDERPSKPS